MKSFLALLGLLLDHEPHLSFDHQRTDAEGLRPDVSVKRFRSDSLIRLPEDELLVMHIEHKADGIKEKAVEVGIIRYDKPPPLLNFTSSLKLAQEVGGAPGLAFPYSTNVSITYTGRDQKKKAKREEATNANEDAQDEQALDEEMELDAEEVRRRMAAIKEGKDVKKTLKGKGPQVMLAKVRFPPSLALPAVALNPQLDRHTAHSTTRRDDRATPLCSRAFCTISSPSGFLSSSARIEASLLLPSPSCKYADEPIHSAQIDQHLEGLGAFDVHRPLASPSNPSRRSLQSPSPAFSRVAVPAGPAALHPQALRQAAHLTGASAPAEQSRNSRSLPLWRSSTT